MRCLIWFKEDLRVDDNTALYHATLAATDGVVAIYVISPQAWKQHDVAACRVDFTLRNLKVLSQRLAKLNIPLLVREARTEKEVPDILFYVASLLKIDALYCNQQYELDEARRDLKVEALCKQNQIKFFSYMDQTILAPGDVLTAKNNYFTVFTPFKNAWLKRFAQQIMHVLPTPKKQKQLNLSGDEIPETIAGFNSNIATELWPAGEVHAQQRLQGFVETKIAEYAKQRDFPIIDGTSQLSPYLAAGIISPRQCLQAALQANQFKLTSGNAGILTWMSELIWREFYKHVLHNFPRVSMHRAFKLQTEELQWNNDSEVFKAWCEGKTGYPIVDAAMRQLHQIGWMHNRLRMLVAMFLVKDLWIDWRWGEKYFMQNLIDGDLAANNGGWQWAASTGTDAVPYFRIFNPITQSKKFDPNGDFIRRFCPELSALDKNMIHDPDGQLRKKINYPQMIVDHKVARERALKHFKKLGQ